MPDPIALLKQDHRDVKRLLERLGETDRGAERQRLIGEVEMNLSLHMEIEEQLLYPRLAQEDPEQGEEAEIEHGLAREGLQKLREMQDRPGFGAVVEMLRGGIEHHVQEEETEILPMMKSELERDEWMAIGDRIVAMKLEAGMPVPKAAPAKKSSAAKKTTATKKPAAAKKSSATKSSAAKKAAPRATKAATKSGGARRGR